MSSNTLPKTAVLLAAGRGSRLRPHTDHTPKPLLPVAGRPTLDYVLTAVARAGIERVVIVTHYLQQQIFDFVGTGARWGLQAAFAQQPAMLGTAHALECAINAQPTWFDTPFLLCATDYIL
ncbi:MAG TPA: nucleotidyltransferase family protein, partial [Anaerolineae bacterium]|nr:nucleotidyltransferase family protein [Anaerolineae bacterium]